MTSTTEISVDQELPTLEVTIEPAQMFLFSAATYNSHRIHYDRQWAIDVEGYPDIVVQGQLQAALLARLVTDWMGPVGSLVEYSLQNRGAVFAGATLTFGGRIASAVDCDDGSRRVDLVLEGRRADGTVIMPGSAVVILRDR